MAIKKKHVDLFGVPKGPIKILRGPGRGDVRAVGFRWSKTPDNISRDYRIIVDKIAFANDESPATSPKASPSSPSQIPSANASAPPTSAYPLTSKSAVEPASWPSSHPHKVASASSPPSSGKSPTTGKPPKPTSTPSPSAKHPRKNHHFSTPQTKTLLQIKPLLNLPAPGTHPMDRARGFPLVVAAPRVQDKTLPGIPEGDQSDSPRLRRMSYLGYRQENRTNPEWR